MLSTPLYCRYLPYSLSVVRQAVIHRPIYPTPSPPHAGLGSMPAANLLSSLPTTESGSNQPALTLGPGVSGNPVSAPTMAWVANLLPVGGSIEQGAVKGIYIGEGLPPVPQKLAERIRRWEYVEMAELLPELWTAKLEDPPKQSAARRKSQVTDLVTWTQCFAVYVAVMAGKHPEAVPELMAYLISIVRASQDYTGAAWVRYDAAYRRQAASNGNRTWSRINPSLFSLCFTGKAQGSPRCELCLAMSHSSADCSLSADTDPDLPSRLKAVEAAVVAFASPARRAERKTAAPFSSEICKNWNEKRCTFRRCRYRHACASCGGAHPVADCPGKQRGQLPPSAATAGHTHYKPY